MSRLVACPGEDTLAALAGGELTDSALPRVVLHAAECSDCRLQLSAAEAESELLNGRYRLLRKLGEGGMGVVFEADDVVLGERVALKLLRAELSREERALEYLKSEVKLSRPIGHAHVCRVFDLGSQNSSGTTVHYLSMELLRGPSLRSLLANGALTPQLALRLAEQVLYGLQAAHSAGVLHRDLKPDNMLLRYPSPAEPHAVITDFGLARAFRAGQRHVTASRTLVGSAAYLAPEQVEEAPLTEATDVYSFGVVLFELLTGQQPFSGETPLGVALKRLHVQPPRPSALMPSLSERYDAFVLRCLARDPNARFQSAAEARVALQALLEAPARAPRPRGGVSFSAVCMACAISLWTGAEHEIASPRVPQPTAAESPGLELAQYTPDTRSDLPLTAAAEPASVVAPSVAGNRTHEARDTLGPRLVASSHSALRDTATSQSARRDSAPRDSAAGDSAAGDSAPRASAARDLAPGAPLRAAAPGVERLRGTRALSSGLLLTAAQVGAARDVPGEAGVLRRAEVACSAPAASGARSQERGRACSARADIPARPQQPAAPAQPGVADVLTPEGFLDPFAD